MRCVSLSGCFAGRCKSVLDVTQPRSSITSYCSSTFIRVCFLCWRTGPHALYGDTQLLIEVKSATRDRSHEIVRIDCVFEGELRKTSLAVLGFVTNCVPCWTIARRAQGRRTLIVHPRGKRSHRLPEVRGLGNTPCNNPGLRQPANHSWRSSGTAV